MKISEKISIVSTCPARLFNHEGQGVWEGIQKYYPNINFYFYHENSFEKKQTGDFINFNDIDIPPNYHIFDLFELYDDLEGFLKTSEFNTCDALSTLANDPSTREYWNRNSIYWFRKTPSIFHASKICTTPLLLFLDADSYITPSNSGASDEFDINEDYINWALQHDVLSRHRKPTHTETGHIVFNLEKRGRELAEKFYSYYRTGKAFGEYRWDDCWIFDVLTEKLKVSNGPLSVATGAPYNFESIIDHHKGEWKDIRTLRKGI
jgi:hypothetical protein